MKFWIKGKEHDIPIREDGTVDVDAIIKAGAILPKRTVIGQGPDGSNEVLNPGTRIPARPEVSFTDAPMTIRGG